MLVSVSVGGDSEVGSDAIPYSVSNDVLSDLYRSLKTTNSTDSNEGSDCVPHRCLVRIQPRCFIKLKVVVSIDPDVDTVDFSVCPYTVLVL